MLGASRSLARLLLLIVGAFLGAVAVLTLIVGLIALFGNGANGWVWLGIGVACAGGLGLVLFSAVRVGRVGRRRSTELYPSEDAVGDDARAGALVGGFFLCLFLGAVGLVWAIGVGIAGGSIDDWTAVVVGVALLVPGVFVMEAGYVVGR